jgi:hypothetical protein
MRRPASADLALSRRAIILGMILVVFLAAVTPYNDDVLHNSQFIGNHLPIGIITILALLILAVNPLMTLLRARPFTPGELIVILTMQLIAAAAPASGLMRYLEPMMVTPFWHIRQFPYLKEITDLLPAWLFPTRNPDSPIISDYWYGVDPHLPGSHIPILPFIIPSLLWGIFIAAIMGSSLFLAAIFRRQWVHHERLTYPLATIPLELMAAPEAGRLYNSRWRNPVLWMGVAIPVMVYFLAGMHSKFPGVPQIDLQFQLRKSFADRPWDVLPDHIVNARLYFAAVGICFFIPSEVAFSLWLFLLLNGLARVFFARTSFDPALQEDARSMGTYVTYFLGLLWLARGHLKYIAQSAWRRAPRAEDEPLTYRTMLLGWLICKTVAWIWLIAVGMNPLTALILLAVGAMLVTLMARIVAETGLFFVNVNFWPRDFLNSLLGKSLLSTRSDLWTQITSGIFYADFRENLTPFAANSMRMGQEIPHTASGPTDQRSRWFRWLVWSLVVSVLVSGITNHFLSYHYGRIKISDSWASLDVPKGALAETYNHSTLPQQSSLSASWTNFGIGSVSALILMAGRVTWAGWPLHPIGLLLMDSSSMKVFWFSIFIGWGVKRLLLRYGGAGAFKRARPFFIGLIVGETLSAGIWLFIGLLSNGSFKYSFLPG